MKAAAEIFIQMIKCGILSDANIRLQLLLNPGQQEDMIESILRMDDQSGWLPMFPRLNGDFAGMIGQHANQVIIDAYFKGYQ